MALDIQPSTRALPAAVAPEPGAAGAAGTRTLVDVLAATTRQHGDRVAIHAPDATLTYMSLAAAADVLARRLGAAGVGPGDRVGVRVASGTAALYTAILGVLTAGAAYVPVDAEDPDGRASAIWEESGVCAVVGDGLELIVRGPGGGRRAGATAGDDAWIIFTSGSSGRPKGVAVTHRSAVAFVAAEAALWTVAPEDRVLAGLSVAFDASCEEMWLAWANGAALVPAPRHVVRSGADLGPWLAEQGVTVVSTVPTLAAMWDDEVLDGVRLLITGGEALPAELGWRLAARCEVWNTYGPTEATVVSTAARVRPDAPVVIGLPLEGWAVAVVGEDGEPVAFGAPGELIIGGVGLGRYLDPELDARRYAPQPALGWTRAYRTGDIVRETDAGLSFVGRRDDQVKLGGRRLELGEIDAHLASAPGVRAAAAAVQHTEAGNPVLVGYVTGDVELERVRAHLAGHLPHGVVPLVVAVATLPVRSSGKVDRQALPWPPPAPPHRLTRELQGTCAWLAERWAEQLGPLPIGADSDFFELGGSSVAAAKLVSVLRADFPAVAVADVYHHRRLHAFAERLEHLGAGATAFDAPEVAGSGRWGAVQVAGVLVLIAYLALQGLIGVLAFNRWQGGNLGPAVGWGWIVGGWAVLFSVPARAALVLVLQRVLLRDLRPGRSPRRGSLACRVWFVERFSQLARLETLAGTPWAGRYARLAGATVGAGARLGTLPPATSIVRIGAGATLEPDVDVHGWWMESDELVLGTLVIEAGASVGTRSVLMPGVTVGVGAEVEPGSVVSEDVPAGERWAGIPARHVGTASELWPQVAAPVPSRPRLWRALYAAGLITQTLLPLACAIPALLLVQVFAPSGQSLTAVVSGLVLAAPVLATAFLLTYAVGVALAVRALTLLVRPGLHPDLGAVGWALWLSETLMAQARVILFPLYSTVYTRPWLRLMGVRVGRRTEVSTGVGLNRLVSFGELSFAADDVVFATARARDGWLEVAPIAVGDRSFLGNGALVRGGTAFGHDSLAGVLTIPPRDPRHGTSWFGWPALELPRVPDAVEAARTTDPSRARVAARAAMEAFRILSPFTISLVLGELDFLAVDAVGRAGGPAAMVAVAPLALLAAALAATAVTILAKWTLIGRYRSGNHPLWSFFVWRDEIINSYQEQLAGGWLLNLALGTPIMPAYLRAMGARVGDRVYIETLTITEFDLVDLGDDCAVNRRSCVETHLFHDRLMRIGPTTIEARSTLGPASAVLPDSTVGDHCWLGARSVVVRGERLPPRTAWHGAPVVAV